MVRANGICLSSEHRCCLSIRRNSRGERATNNAPRLRGAVHGSDAPGRRYRGDGQPSSAQSRWPSRMAIKSARATLWYPPKYSPDLNPIELTANSKRCCARLPSGLSESLRGDSLFRSAARYSGMPQLLQACWLCFRMTGIRFSPRCCFHPVYV